GVGLALGSLVSLLLPGVAGARNPHCAGGIQYVVGGLRDKGAGNTEDYLRQMQKAVQQLEDCAAQDSTDYEALGYLGWAYAEIDSCGPAGRWSAKAIDGLNARGDKKKAEIAANNRDAYWGAKPNERAGRANRAQPADPDYRTEADTDAAKRRKAAAA